MFTNVDVDDVVMLVGGWERPTSLSLLINKTGIVRAVNSRGIGIEFDEDVPGGNNLHGAIKNTRGFYVPIESVIKLRPVKDVIKNLYMEGGMIEEKMCN